MSDDPSKKDATISSADDLVKTNKGDVELTEEELKRVSGGREQSHPEIQEIHVSKYVDKATP